MHYILRSENGELIAVLEHSSPYMQVNDLREVFDTLCKEQIGYGHNTAHQIKRRDWARKQVEEKKRTYEECWVQWLVEAHGFSHFEEGITVTIHGH